MKTISTALVTAIAIQLGSASITQAERLRFPHSCLRNTRSIALCMLGEKTLGKERRRFDG